MKTTALIIDHLQDPITIVLMASLLLVGIFANFSKALRFKLVLHPVSVIRQKEYYRLVSSDFIHHDLAHLLLNEFLLYIYGGNLEDYLNQTGKYGSLEFIGIYLASCLMGSAATTILNRKEFGFTSAGASGSIMGCMFSYVILRPGRVAFYLPVIGPVNNIYFGLISILILFVYQWRSNNELINQEQHFFGALGGMATTLLMFHGLIR